MAEKVRLKIGSLSKAVLVTGQAYQDPKDALNEFVSNAADEYAQAERPGGRVRVVLRRKGRYPVIAFDDDGRGMSPDRLKEVARSLFASAKAGDERVLGDALVEAVHQAPEGLLAAGLLEERLLLQASARNLHHVSMVADTPPCSVGVFAVVSLPSSAAGRRQPRRTTSAVVRRCPSGTTAVRPGSVRPRRAAARR